VDYTGTEIITPVQGMKTLSITDLTIAGNTVTFNTPAAQTISLSLFSIDGRLIENRKNMPLSTGRNTVTLTVPLSSGMYICRFNNEHGTAEFKFVTMTRQ